MAFILWNKCARMSSKKCLALSTHTHTQNYEIVIAIQPVISLIRITFNIISILHYSLLSMLLQFMCEQFTYT